MVDFCLVIKDVVSFAFWMEERLGSFPLHKELNACPVAVCSHRRVLFDKPYLDALYGREVLEQPFGNAASGMFQQSGRDAHLFFYRIVYGGVAYGAVQLVGFQCSAEIRFNSQVYSELCPDGGFLRVYAMIGVET